MATALSVVDLKIASGDGNLKDNNDGTFTFTPAPNWNGEVDFSYGVSDGQGHIEVCNGTISSTAAGADLTVVRVLAPVVSGPVDLGSSKEDTIFTFSAKQLLANASRC